MLLHLVKKDFLVIKKYVLLMFIVAIAIPPFMFWRAPQYGGTMGFVLSIIFSVFMLLQYTSLKEYQFPKAAMLLCSAPIPRKLLVVSKYIFCMLIYGVCCMIFGIETLIFPELGTLQLNMLLMMFLVTSAFIGIYLPVQYKLGYEKTKFAFAAIIVASPIILPMLLKMENINLSVFANLSPAVLCGVAVLVGVLILTVSAFLSILFYSQTDLA